MELDYLKELTPVIYGEKAVKLLKFKIEEPNYECIYAHWHERIEVILVKSGTLNMTIDNKEYALNKNGVGVVMPRKLHRGVSGSDGVEYTAVMFDISYLTNKTLVSSKYFDTILSGKSVFECFSYDASVRQAVENIEKHYFSKKPTDSIKIISDIYNLIAEIYNTLFVKMTDKKFNNEFDGILEYVSENFRKPISSKSLSRKFGYDEAYFCRKFKAMTGISPIRYINILRLEKAQKLFENSDNSISGVAAACGFQDANYFTRCFKKQYGITPTQFINEKNSFAKRQ